MQPNEIYLIDMWRIVRRRWPWTVGVALATIVATFAGLHMARSQWEAVAAIQVGQVGTVPQGVDPRVEPFQRVLLRLQGKAFQDDVLHGLGLVDDSDEARLYRARTTLDPDLYANVIRVHVRGYSAEDARQLAVATVDRLVALHAAMSRAQLEATRKRSADIDRTIVAAEQERDRLTREVATAAHGDAMLASLALANADAGLRTMKQIRADLDARMLPSATFPTSMPWPVTVSPGPVAPAKVPLMAIGVLAGLLLGVMAATAVDALSRSTKRERAGTYGAEARRGGERYEHAATPGGIDAA